MFPPESSGTVVPVPATLPLRSAATPTAPAPSTTSFVRSSRSTIASLICSSVTETMSSSTRSRIDIVSSPGFFTAMPSAIVKPGPSGSVPAACTPTIRTPGLHRAQRERDAGGEPAAADRDEHRVDVVHLLGELEADRPLAGDDDADPRTGGRTSRRVSATYARAASRRVLDRRARQLDLGAVVARRLDLRHRRVLRHEDARVRADLARRPRDRLPVVAGARRDDAGRALLGRQRRDPVVRAADLERAGALEVLRLEMHLAAARARQRLGAVDRRDARDAFEARARLLDLRKSGAVAVALNVEDLLQDLLHGAERVELAPLHLVEQPPQLGIVGDDRARDGASRAPTRRRTPRRRGCARRRSSSCPDSTRYARCASIFSQSSGTFSPRVASVSTIGGRQSRSRSSARIERTSFSIVFAAG